VDAAGVSFTEKEYDYAVERKKTVLAFIHGDPGSIAVNKVDTDPALAAKLNAFREKVSKGRLVRYWKSAGELEPMVIKALVKAFSDMPATGWIRGDAAASEDLLVPNNNLRNLAEQQAPQEGLEKKQFSRVVASGTNQRIGFFCALNPDCSASGDVKIRVTKQPEHGSTETTTAINFPNYPKENIRSKCNDHKVDGMQVNYKSAEKYVGSDELELLVLFPAGFAWEVRYNIDVR
jgi:hypothetical protein